MPDLTPQQKAWRKRPEARNIHAPRGKHWCHYHPDKDGNRVGAYLPKKNFNKNRSKFHGLNDRCRDCDRDYRLEYEARHGKRQDQTKTLRVSPRVHQLAKDSAKAAGAPITRYVSAALVFYATYGCQHPGCTRPSSRYGRCDRHILSIVTTEESAG